MTDDLRARSRPIEWGTHRLTQGELLDGFARHCVDDLEDVTVEESSPTLLVARWRAEVSRIELRAHGSPVEHVTPDMPTLVITEIGESVGELVSTMLDAPELRPRVLVFDPGRLEKVGAVRSSVFVYFEWHLRDAYGVKVVPNPAFTQGLIERGVISLGMG